VKKDINVIAFFTAAAFGTALILSQAGCPNGPVGPIVNGLIDCLGSNRPEIDKLLNEFRPIISGGNVSWDSVKQRAKHAGKDIGGCFIMELTQLYLSGTRSPADAKLAYDAAEAFRNEEVGGATFRTICVREDGTKQECKL